MSSAIVLLLGQAGHGPGFAQTGVPTDPATPVSLQAKPTARELEFVNLAEHIPGLVIELPYATAKNFLKRPVYQHNQAFLRRPVADLLALVQADLVKQGLGLKILDAYRPLNVQRQMWDIMPNATYVANPAKGSRHNRGAAVDVTLVDRTGKELEMPTAFDDFSEKANIDSPASPTATRNRALLQEAMKRHGFSPMASEWWHFDAPGWERFPVEDLAFSQLAGGTSVVPTAPSPAAAESATLEERVSALERELQFLRRQITELERLVPGQNAKPGTELKGKPIGN